MKGVTRYTAFLIGLLSLCFSCREECCQDCVDSKCRFASIITAQSGCYDAEKGLVLTATGNAPDLSYQIWTVYVVKDTTNGFTPTDFKINEYRNGNITIPDSILLDNQQVVAGVTTWCNGSNYDSMYFRFTRAASNNCTTWIGQDKPRHIYYCLVPADILESRLANVTIGSLVATTLFNDRSFGQQLNHSPLKVDPLNSGHQGS